MGDVGLVNNMILDFVDLNVFVGEEVASEREREKGNTCGEREKEGRGRHHATSSQGPVATSTVCIWDLYSTLVKVVRLLYLGTF